MSFGLQSYVITELFARFALDLAAMALLLFGMYYPRYRDKETVTAASLFNVFVFAVLAVLSSVEFSLAAGFGLFAILALFTLRSEQITKIEITYFFGSISIAVITAVLGTSLSFVLLMLALVLIGAYLLDHPRILQSEERIRLTLDRIPSPALSDPEALCRELSSRLGVVVLSTNVRSVDYITEMVVVDVYYRKHARR